MRRIVSRQGTSPVQAKIVITGPFAAGKSTLIRTISEIPVLSTERPVTDGHQREKAQTTVAMDFGRIALDRDLVLLLFGTPGQARFEFMWEILGEGMLGYVLLVDHDQPDQLEQAAAILATFRGNTGAPFVVALNRAGRLTAEDTAHVRAVVRVAASVPVLACDVRDRSSVKGVLLALLAVAAEGRCKAVPA